MMSYIPAQLASSNKKHGADRMCRPSSQCLPTLEREGSSRSLRSFLKKAIPSGRLKKKTGEKPSLDVSSTMSTITVTSESSNVSDVSFAERPILHFGQTKSEQPAAQKTRRSTVDYWSFICSHRIEHCGPESLSLAMAHYQRGAAHLTAGHHNRAIKDISTAVCLFEERFGIHHLGFPRSLHLLSRAARAAGKLDVAYAAAKQAFSIRRDELGTFHVDTIETYSEIGYCLRDMDEKKRAAVCLGEALKATKLVYGHASMTVVSLASDLADLCVELGKNDKARRHYKTVLKGSLALGLPQKISAVEQKMYEVGISETRLEL